MRTILVLMIGAAAAWGQLSGKPHKVKSEEDTYKGKKALRVVDAAAGQPGDGGAKQRQDRPIAPRAS